MTNELLSLSFFLDFLLPSLAIIDCIERCAEIIVQINSNKQFFVMPNKNRFRAINVTFDRCYVKC